jgi:hypothetical protein
MLGQGKTGRKACRLAGGGQYDARRKARQARRAGHAGGKGKTRKEVVTTKHDEAGKGGDGGIKGDAFWKAGRGMQGRVRQEGQG